MMQLDFMIGLAFSLMEKWGLGCQGVVSIYNSRRGTHTLDKVKVPVLLEQNEAYQPCLSQLWINVVPFWGMLQEI